ncbi:bifunctional 4-hydroxy-2-oxoglutarate aldolase/2-dehydro-3-deoxy-phosphogluconate aldolase [Rhodocytophaga rosea]|nr:bifunctional 4-hydroxy-2-oxoglutarate aldolase/2-dehydro-3-deoxy-phosphogluconate aldolase [Rhodocytophaga rosea]
MPFSWELFHQKPIIGILRSIPGDIIQQIIPLYIQAGFTTIEITMNTAGAEQLIQETAEAYGTTLNVGAGTVCNEKDLANALHAGASFIVTPILNESVIRTCVENRIPIFPGAYTPTEIYTAWNLGASMVKVFPANRLGPEYIQEVKAPLSQIKLVPTGGVTVNNFTDFFKAGADGVGMGSQLFNKTLLASRDWDGLLTHFKSVHLAYEQLQNKQS